ncbi:hypothetical protein SUGI_0961050 [Cryptomeria japonica]|uniref:plant intracellular Ras-group-related LRR protein 4 n=1 Tax=Cryptomeria japonica TaxID=3369 RepID=UPI002414778A|nr:plant intracellular Ras-group-related LRR protein 4 [Cryptomeria japonica]GLJ45660.1 hypothetical protein SUGI_0961050 [Cryptomeria japonica]
MRNLEELVEEITRTHKSLPPRPSGDEVEAALFLIRNVDSTKDIRLQTLKRQAKPPDAPEELFAVMQEMRRIRAEIEAEEEKREALALLLLEDHHRLFDYLVQKAFCALPSSSSAPTYVPDAPFSVRNSGKRIANGADADFVGNSEHREKEILYVPDVNSSKRIVNGNSADFAVSAEHRQIEILGRDSKQSRDDSFIQKPRSVFPDGRSEAAPINLLAKSRRITLEERQSFGRLSGTITDTKAEGGQKLSLVKLASLIETAFKDGAEKLDLRGRLLDQVEWLPESIGKLTNLTEMNLSENRIMTLPSSIQGLSMLTKLDLHANKLMDIPDAIGELSNLTILDAHGNCLQKLPASVGNLFRLTCLDLSSNQLISLPESVGKLVNLKRLDIETNEIEELPYTIGQCVSLTELRADFNHLKALPEAIGKLVSLEVLTLHYNNIKSLPTTMGSLSNLRELDLSFNELEYIPESLCLATSLVKLNVSRNFADLQNLPRSIGNLEMLEDLDISNDQIKFLPDSFSMLTKLHILHAEETPLEIPPREIAANGAEAVVQFMIEHVAKRNDDVIEIKPKWKWSMFCSCLKKRKREESNARYTRAGA